MTWTFIFFLILLLEYNCLIMLLVYNMNQLSVYIEPLPLEPLSQPPPSHLSRSSQRRAELPELHSSFPPAVYLIRGTVYTATFLSQSVPPSLSPAGSRSSFSTSVSLLLTWTFLSPDNLQSLLRSTGKPPTPTLQVCKNLE